MTQIVEVRRRRSCLGGCFMALVNILGFMLLSMMFFILIFGLILI